MQLRAFASLIAGLCLRAGAAAQPLVVPVAYTTAGSGVSPADAVLSEFPRCHQQIISASQLSGIPIGSSITQITMRASNFGTFNTLGNWPASPRTFVNYEIYLARAARAPGNMSTVFAQNIVPGSEVRVRSGSLTIPMSAYANFVALPGANPWGMDMQVSPFVYTGGDLVITIRHTGHQAAGTPRLFVDSLSNPSGTPATQQCMGAPTFTATTGTAATTQPAIFRFRWVAPATCYANCDHSTVQPFLNVNDYICFLNQFALGLAAPANEQAAAWANCDGSTTAPALNIVDFVCFNNKYAVGCPNP